jgi:ribosomal protein S8
MNIQTIKNLNKLKNASLIKSESISLGYSFLILNIIQNLYKEGFIQSFKIKKDLVTDKKFILVNLRYYFNKSIFNKLKTISSASKIKALDFENLSRLNIKKDVLFLSTSEGILTHLECKHRNLGGVLFFIC